MLVFECKFFGKFRVKDLAVRFNRRSVLNGISFSAASGDLITVVGENAAGKTTLLKSLAGLVKYDGSVTLAEHGTALSDASVVYLPQLTAVTSHLSVFETVMLGLGQRLSWRIDDEVFDRTDAQLHAMNISRLAALPVQKLSGGQKQLVFMAQAFISRPRLLLLDEPTSALDLKHQLTRAPSSSPLRTTSPWPPAFHQNCWYCPKAGFIRSVPPGTY